MKTYRKILFHSYQGITLVWFAQSATFLQLQEPGKFVLDQFIGLTSINETVQLCIDRYERPREEAKTFVEELYQSFNHLNTQKDEPTKVKEVLIDDNPAFITQHYRMLGKIIRIEYPNAYISHIIHPLFEHQSVEAQEFNTSICITTNSNGSIIKQGGYKDVNFKSDQITFLKGALFLRILEAMHNKSTNDWLGTLHAGCISNGESCILFPAAAGSGKSTFTALLNAEGYQLLSDDFVGICNSEFNAYQLPSAISIKKGSIPVLSSKFPELLSISDENVKNNFKNARYVKAKSWKNEIASSKVSVIVFVKYEKDSPLLFEKLDDAKSILKIMEEMWVSRNADNIQHFFKFLETTPFYTLQYSNFKEAHQEINKLFNER